MLLVAELDLRQLQLALALDIGLVGPVDHDVGDGGVGEQLFERPQAEQLVDQHLFQRELFAAVQRQLQLGEHFANDRAEFFGQLVLAQRRRGFRIDAFQQTRQHLFLDLVDRGFEALVAAAARIAAGILPLGQPGHRIDGAGGRRSGERVLGGEQSRFDRRELAARRRVFRRPRRHAAALHRARDAERRPRRLSATHSVPTPERAHTQFQYGPAERGRGQGLTFS